MATNTTGPPILKIFVAAPSLLRPLFAESRDSFKVPSNSLLLKTRSYCQYLFGLEFHQGTCRTMLSSYSLTRRHNEAAKQTRSLQLALSRCPKRLPQNRDTVARTVPLIRSIHRKVHQCMCITKCRCLAKCIVHVQVRLGRESPDCMHHIAWPFETDLEF